MNQINHQDISRLSLKVIATPIGNMGDITIRALDTLRDCDVILSEDTRETDKLLKHYEITGKSNISYREQNHDRIKDTIISMIKSGKQVVLVSDSGTPLISDPGFKLVRDLVANEIEIDTLPGPSAVIASLVVSGLPTDKFTFLGFLPRKSNERQKILFTYGETDASLVIYESPFRVYKLLEDVQAALGNREVCLINDITKVYEKITRGNVEFLLNSLQNVKLKGEFSLIIAKKDFILK